ncbi:hypothetical protein N431DRAFT_212704 [Stipitochalara longipes BDJ]|nr:hypothetical protein N431DRAFT_212704 [Stipitochalara longipes BDJ]
MTERPRPLFYTHHWPVRLLESLYLLCSLRLWGVEVRSGVGARSPCTPLLVCFGRANPFPEHHVLFPRRLNS